MKAFLTLALSALSLAIVSCKDPQEPDKNDGKTGNLPPVETLPPNTDYPPAFPQQTRVAGIKTKTPLSINVLAEGLSKPWGMVSLPDGRLLITEKTGTLRIATIEGQLSPAITGLPPVNSSGQGGLLDIVPDPDFETNRTIYWVFSENQPGGTLTAVAKGQLNPDESQVLNISIIFRAIPAYNGSLHYGGRILFDANGYLLVSTGERSDLETRPQAQWLHSGLGKVLRITKTGDPAPGNPFSDSTEEITKSIYSYGHRNIQGLAIHPETGVLWEGEFGPRGGDELNKIEAGNNYGWPIISYGLEYSGEPIGDGITQQEGMEQPVYYWDPVISPSGMVFYNSQVISEWKNDLFLACLSGQHIARLVISDDRVIAEERLLADKGERFRDLAVGHDGALYAITDDGSLYRIGKQ